MGAFDGVWQKSGEEVELECNGIWLACVTCVRVLTVRREVLWRMSALFRRGDEEIAMKRSSMRFTVWSSMCGLAGCDGWEGDGMGLWHFRGEEGTVWHVAYARKGK